MFDERSLLEARPRVLPSQTTRISTTLGAAFVTLTRDSEGQPFEFFLNVGKAGSETYATAEALGRLISLALRLNSPVSRAERVHELADQLEHIGATVNSADRPSIPDALARILREALTGSYPNEPGIPSTPKAIKTESIAKTDLAFSSISNPLMKGNKQKNMMDTKVVTLPENISNAAEQLAAAILRVEPISAYQQAKARMDADLEAHELLERLSKAQADLRERHTQNTVTQADVEQLRALQRQVQSNPMIMDYAETQQKAIAYLPEVNQEISQLLGVDFASLAGPASC
jgi:cell fate (sporulation/competence/biofilm development) regulator YlbF (YheA/YmcA/DUF963 family)